MRMTRWKSMIVLLAPVLMLCACNAAADPEPVEAVLETEEQKTLYALGLALSGRLAPFKLTEDDIALIQAGLADGAMSRENRVDLQAYGPKIDELMRERLLAAAEIEKAAGVEFMAKAGEETGAVKTDSGMLYVEREAGDGPIPTADSTVKLHYEGTFRDGESFDSSIGKEPAVFPLNQVAPCFSEGLQRMKVGGKSKLVCPPDLAYGDDGFPPMIPPGATLIFEIELLEIVNTDGGTGS